MDAGRPEPAGRPFLPPLAGGGPPLVTERRGAELRVRRGEDPAPALRLSIDGTRLVLLEWAGPAAATLAALAAAAEAVLGWQPDLAALTLVLAGELAGDLAEPLRRRGLAIEQEGALVLRPDLLMQQRDLWLAEPDLPAFPLRYVMTEGRRHPLRPPKPEGLVYARFIPWLGQTLDFRAATLEEDLARLNAWMNDPRVAAFWNEEGDLEKHRRYLAGLIADPHMLPLMASLDGEPFGYFEIYWAKENRLGPFYEARDHDRGWHVVIGEERCRGRRYIAAWLPSLMHYLFLDDCRTTRIVGEPAAAHRQQIRNLETSGFAAIKNFDFPHKRATLVMLLRERFFADRLWLPAVPLEARAEAAQ